MASVFVKITVTVLSVILHLCLVESYYDSNATNEDIEERLDILGNEIARLKDQFAEFKGGNNDYVDSLHLVPLEAKREFVEEGVKFTVTYRTTSEEPVQLYWWVIGKSWAHCEEYRDNSIPRRLSGVHSTSVIVPPAEEYLSLFISSDDLGFVLDLRNSLTGNMEQTDIPIPVLKVDPPGDIAYNDGEDSTIKVTIPKETTDKPHPGDSIQSSHFDVHVYTVNPDTHLTKSLSYPIDNDGYFQVTTLKKYLDSEEVEVKLNTSGNYFGGFVELHGALNDNSTLVRRIEIIRRLVIRPASQAGPLPAGYLEFSVSESTEVTTAGEEKISCSYDERCTFGCTVIGEEISDISMAKLLPDGTEEPIPFEQYKHPLEYSANAYADVTGKPRTVREERYRCKARNLEGKTASHILLVSYSIRTAMVLNESDVTWINDEELNITCTARGDPLPSLTLDLYYHYKLEPLVEPDTIQVAGDKITLSKVVPASLGRFGDFFDAHCAASAGDGLERNDSYTMRKPGRPR